MPIDVVNGLAEAYSCPSGTPTGGSTTVTTSAAGSSFEIAVRYFGTAPTVVSDSKSNTYVLRTPPGEVQNPGDGDNMQVWRCENGTGGAGHKPVLTFGSTTSCAVSMVEITGGVTSSGQDGSAAGNLDSASPYSQGVTTTNANDAVISWCGSNATAAVTFTPNGSFTLIAAATFTDGTTSLAVGVAKRIVGATGTYDPAWTTSSGSKAIVITAALKATAGGAVASKILSLLGVG